MIVLGIETSCDETAVAVVRDHPRPEIRANLVRAQLAEHAPFGGVVPEIAARAHLDHISALIRRALEKAAISLGDLDGIAAAAGPGLIGGLIVGTMVAKGIAWAAQKPFIAVNHLEAHALTARLSHGVVFPYLLLLVSGGHSQLLVCAGIGDYRVLGKSRDDAAGEAFDKTAKLLGLGYPGGPAIAEAARKGDSKRFSLPRPLKGRAGCDFSFSGLKTAVRQIIAECPPRSAQDTADLAAAIELAIGDTLIDRTENAIAWFRNHYPEGKTLVTAGGVAANLHLRDRLSHLATAARLDFIAPPPSLCTDNGAMIAWAGLERLRLDQVDGLDAPVRPRWPLDDDVPDAVPAARSA
ncbi:MAG: tRNA (adenosine(37)-N6)-threonylcarbamoyltransferase complex transferase subunit TsaD [Alphaproteobacteria bacterium]|nr:tRNA (adenosine(37)-N6)-threonylcarbamoyltransferase complex transferase subunit TsaD [Alphaproteobacteria bacterium]MBV9016886.1 tRNA (adenosine(37)-N6)-threonylcarbamoyltransferase complex transferase subunit TsaD [Alphaproteobacteria bacterium]